MRRSLFIIMYLLCINLTVSAQAPYFDWAKSISGFNDDKGRFCAVDGSANVYTVGYFKGSTDFDPGVGSTILSAHPNKTDGFIQKLDASGNFEWAISIKCDSTPSSNSCILNSIVIDMVGDIYVSGYLFQSADFDPGPNVLTLGSSTNTRTTNFLAKYSPNGSLIWAKGYGGTIGITSLDSKYLAIDANNNLIITGTFKGSLDFDPSLAVNMLTSSSLNGDAFITKFDSSGSYQWTKAFQSLSSYGNSSDGYAVAVDALGNIYSTGQFQGTTDFDPGVSTFNLSTSISKHIYISKLDGLGNFIWAKFLDDGSSLNNGGGMGTSLAIDNNGNVLVTGDFNGTLDFDPGGFSANLTANSVDIFILKLNGNGNYVWAKNVGGNDLDRGECVTVDGAGGIYITGSFRNTVDFNPGLGVTNLTSLGGKDIFLMKLDSNGIYSWSSKFGGWALDEQGWCVTVQNSKIYLTGYFASSSDFDPSTGVFNLTSTNIDVFVLKLSNSLCTTTYGTDVLTGCDSLTWMNGNTYYSNSYGAKDTIVNAGGCDSIITLNLTINNSSSSTDVLLACDSVHWIDGNTYFANNNSATHLLSNSFGCDSLITLNFTINTTNTMVTQNGTTLTAFLSGGTYQWLDCANAYAQIAGATSQIFTATANGNYAVAIMQNGCSDTSICYSISTVGLNEIARNIGAEIYPNPSNGEMRIDLLGEKIESLYVMNANGQVLLEKKNVNSSEHKISIDSSKGLHFVKVISEESVYYFKVIVH